LNYCPIFVNLKLLGDKVEKGKGKRERQGMKLVNVLGH
jgi:hypothetical protein